MKRVITVIFLFIIFSVQLFAQKQSREEYINKYKNLAIREMNKYGIPASITMAQACLESGDGNSRLATMANNHFGIKCHNWTGKTFTYSDDMANECFRKYDSAEDSFRDHSEFLTNGKRYQSLFSLDKTDYKSWAHGLKAAGYATSPIYAQKLIEIIEKNYLYYLDKDTHKTDISKNNEQTNQAVDSTGHVKTKKELRKERRAEKKRLKEEKKKQKLEHSQSTNTNSNSTNTNSNIITNTSNSYNYSLERTVSKINGVNYVIAIGGETYESIAKTYDLFTKEILSFNDIDTDNVLEEGSIVYIERKKKYNPKNTYQVEQEESIYSISQKTGVRIKNLLIINNISSKDRIIKTGKVIKLQ